MLQITNLHQDVRGLVEGWPFGLRSVLDFGVSAAAADNGPALASLAAGHYLVPPGTYAVASDAAVPAGVVLDFVGGAALKPVAGITVTLNGPVRAGLYRVFDVSAGGGIRFGAGTVTEAYPEWFGAAGDGVAVDSAPFQKALDAVAPFGVPLALQDGRTYLVSGLSTTAGAVLSVIGRRATLKYAGGGVGGGTTDVYLGNGVLLNALAPRRVVLDLGHVDGNAAVTAPTCPALVRVETATDGSTELVEVAGDWTGGGVADVFKLFYVINHEPEATGARRVVIRDGRWKDPAQSGFWGVRGKHELVVVRDVVVTDPSGRTVGAAGHLCDFTSERIPGWPDAIHRLHVSNFESRHSIADVIFIQGVLHRRLVGVVIDRMNQTTPFTAPGGSGIKIDDMFYHAEQSTYIRDFVARNTSQTAGARNNIWLTEGSRHSIVDGFDIDGNLAMASSGEGDESFIHVARNGICRDTGQLVCGRYSVIENVKLRGPEGGSTPIQKLQLERDCRISGLKLENYAFVLVPSNGTVEYTNISIGDVDAEPTCELFFQRSHATHVQQVVVRGWRGGVLRAEPNSNVSATLRVQFTDCTFQLKNFTTRQVLFQSATYEGRNNRRWDGSKYVTELPDRTQPEGTITTTGTNVALNAAFASVLLVSPASATTYGSITNLLDGQECELILTTPNATITSTALANGSVTGPTVLRVKRVGTKYYRVG